MTDLEKLYKIAFNIVQYAGVDKLEFRRGGILIGCVIRFPGDNAITLNIETTVDLCLTEDAYVYHAEEYDIAKLDKIIDFLENRSGMPELLEGTR